MRTLATVIRTLVAMMRNSSDHDGDFNDPPRDNYISRMLATYYEDTPLYDHEQKRLSKTSDYITGWLHGVSNDGTMV